MIRVASPRGQGLLLATLLLATLPLVTPPLRAADPPDAPESDAARLALAAGWTPPRALLASFGVDVDVEASVVRFLSRGIPDAARAAGLPPEPARRTALIPVAMEAAARLQYRTASAPLLRLLEGDLPHGISRLIEEDALSVPVTSRDVFREEARRLLRQNAANALSLLRESVALPLIGRAMLEERSVVTRLRYALTGATLGSTAHLAVIAAHTTDENPRHAYLALEAFSHVTGLPLTVTPVSPVSELREAARRARAWIDGPGQRFTIDPAAVIERRHTPSPRRPTPRRANSLRDHLILSLAFDDGDLAPLGRESRRHLGELPRELLTRLAAIARDAREDVDIRRQAIFWYIHHAKADALPLLRELRQDENPELRAMAEDYLRRN